MKNNKYICAFSLLVFAPFFLHAQVLSNGQIQNAFSDSNVFLDASTNFDTSISGSNTVGKGLLFPRTDLTKWSFDTGKLGDLIFPSAYDGMVVYNTGSGFTPTGNNNTNISTRVDPGFYYFSNLSASDNISNGVWKPIGGSPINIYNSDGTITETRRVSSSDLIFQGVNNATGSVRINGGTPNEAGYIGIYKGDGTTRLGYIGYDNTNVEYKAENSANHIFNGGKVGILTNPNAVLSVLNPKGDSSTDVLSVGNSNCGAPCLQVDNRSIVLYNTNGTNNRFGGIHFVPSGVSTDITGASIEGIDRDATNGYAGLQFNTRNSTNYGARMTIRSSGDVGIGTVNPAAKLDVAGNIKIADGTQGKDKVLTSDDNGLASWKPLSQIGPSGGAQKIYFRIPVGDVNVTTPGGVWQDLTSSTWFFNGSDYKNPNGVGFQVLKGNLQSGNTIRIIPNLVDNWNTRMVVTQVTIECPRQSEPINNSVALDTNNVMPPLVMKTSASNDSAYDGAMVVYLEENGDIIQKLILNVEMTIFPPN
ncbi:hypothetical protein [Chryseobacterium sp. RU33C]|uniref:hypothetical protein n=1 Tax=Chryseobacterium sp. RU33C TaxID=1907398 RepID=UPI00095529E6|nr:hypothetical protein [Chryseobacterium sp. RU33C]SIR55806.1 hypothetical protein SAMN05880573_12711 [Chryseobacterium sp. RU33C]